MENAIEKVKTTVSYSKLGCYKSCPHAYRLRYIEEIDPIRVQKPLYKGSAIHSLLEQRILHIMDPNNRTWQELLHSDMQVAYDQLVDSDKEEIGDFIEDAEKIMNQYDWCYSEEKMKYLEVEKWIEYPLIRGRKETMMLVGKVDAIVEIGGKQYVLEHKTFSSKPMSLSDTWINVQTSLYAYILNKKYGYHIVGVVWDMIKSEPYAEPNVLKNGTYGKQSSKVTLLSFKEDPGQEIIEQVKDNHLNFLNRFITPLVPKAIEQFIKETKELARFLYYKKEKVMDIKRLSRDCGWCSYHDLCQAELTGGDVEYIKSLLYRKRGTENELSREDEASE